MKSGRNRFFFCTQLSCLQRDLFSLRLVGIFQFYPYLLFLIYFLGMHYPKTQSLTLCCSENSKNTRRTNYAHNLLLLESYKQLKPPLNIKIFIKHHTMHVRNSWLNFESERVREKNVRTYKKWEWNGHAREELKIFEKVEWMESTEGKSFDEK